MAKRKGNNGNHGKKGLSGRKSAFQEKADAARLIDLVTSKYTKKDLVAMAKAKDVPLDLLERMMIRAHGGADKIAIAIFNKVFPERMIISDDLPFGDLD